MAIRRYLHAGDIRRFRSGRFWLQIVQLIALALVASACGATIAPTCRVPTATELELETSDRVNIDQGGEALPTIIRVYQLKNLSALQQASFDDMLDRPKETLGDAVVHEDEVTIYPGQILVRRFEREPKADFIVGVAIVRNPVGSAWRTLQEFPIPGDPCEEQQDPEAAPTLGDLRVRMFMDEYRIESTNNWAGLPLRSCPKGVACKPGAAPDELPEELRHRRLRSFEEDESRPTPTSNRGGTSSN
ncbi:MAG TPA: type VI secretion system lipoprotein TssJ [Polyangiales bacterium]|nr:type VI secretion system lipoprotein TssJ [Polyangiales bacterium]